MFLHVQLLILIVCLFLIKLLLFLLELPHELQPLTLWQVLNTAVKALGCDFRVHHVVFRRISADIVAFQEQVNYLLPLVSRNELALHGLSVFLAKLDQVLLYVIESVAALGPQRPLKLQIALLHRLLLQELDKVEIKVCQIITLNFEGLSRLASSFF